MISAIQVFLFMQLCLVVFCELTPLFANTIKSLALRYSVGCCLIVLMYYSKYLTQAPHIIIMAFFIAVGSLTFLVYKFIFKEYFTRLKRQQRKEYIEQLKAQKRKSHE